jgi:hypothetical protein
MCDNILIMKNSIIRGPVGIRTGTTERAAQRRDGKLGNINRARKKLGLEPIKPNSPQELARKRTQAVLLNMAPTDEITKHGKRESKNNSNSYYSYRW